MPSQAFDYSSSEDGQFHTAIHKQLNVAIATDSVKMTLMAATHLAARFKPSFFWVLGAVMVNAPGKYSGHCTAATQKLKIVLYNDKLFIYTSFIN